MRVAIALLTVAAAEVVVFSIATITAQAENCDNGVSRWECSDTLRDISSVAVWVLLGVLVLLVLVLLSGLRSGRSDGLG
jgi:hypothetical protein